MCSSLEPRVSRPLGLRLEKEWPLKENWVLFPEGTMEDWADTVDSQLLQVEVSDSSEDTDSDGKREESVTQSDKIACARILI